MADYFEEMSFTPLQEGETPNHFLHFARLLRDFGMFEELGEGKRLPPPTSKATLEELPTVEILNDGTTCPVCLKKFEKSEKAVKLPCKHEFHTDCIIPWLKKTSTCPLCRFELPTDDKVYEEYKISKKREAQRKEDLDNLHNSMFG